MIKQDKQKLVEQFQAELKDVPYAVLVDYRGLTVGQATELRSKVRETGSDYRVVKNTLGRLAVTGTPIDSLKDHFSGPTAVVTNSKEPVAMAKALVDFAKDVPNLEIKVACVDGNILQPDEVNELSKMPSRDELLAKLLYLMQYPIQGVATALNGIVRNLAVTLNQVAEKKN
jgi:large subunit ribosomal protein L10